MIHPFSDEEALYAAVTTTRRSIAIPLTPTDFAIKVLPRESYVTPWIIAPLQHADIHGQEGQLVKETVETIAGKAASYLGVK